MHGDRASLEVPRGTLSRGTNRLRSPAAHSPRRTSPSRPPVQSGKATSDALQTMNISCPRVWQSSGLASWILGLTGSAADAGPNDRGVCSASSLARGATVAAASRSSRNGRACSTAPPGQQGRHLDSYPAGSVSASHCADTASAPGGRTSPTDASASRRSGYSSCPGRERDNCCWSPSTRSQLCLPRWHSGHRADSSH